MILNPLDRLGDEVNELVASFTSQPIVGSLDTVGFTQYSFWFAVAIILMLVVLFVFKKKQAASLVPQGAFVNGVEYLVEFVRDDMCKGLLGESWKRHFPFIATIFLVVLANNIVGIIPGCKPGTGTISTTAALALCSFVYFIVCGVKKKGTLGYVKSLAPAGVMFPLNALVWLIEVFSTILRLITLAVPTLLQPLRDAALDCTFAILASLFFEPMGAGVLCGHRRAGGCLGPVGGHPARHLRRGDHGGRHPGLRLRASLRRLHPDRRVGRGVGEKFGNSRAAAR